MNLEILGKKLGMSQVYDADNNLVPVTIIEAGPCPVLQVKNVDKDGYSAIQIGYNPNGKPANHPNKCNSGIAQKVGVDSQKSLRSFVSERTTVLKKEAISPLIFQGYPGC